MYVNYTIWIRGILPLINSQLSSLDFMVNRILMKLVTSSDMQIVEFCRLQFIITNLLGRPSTAALQNAVKMK